MNKATFSGSNNNNNDADKDDKQKIMEICQEALKITDINKRKRRVQELGSPGNGVKSGVDTSQTVTAISSPNVNQNGDESSRRIPVKLEDVQVEQQ